MCIRDSNLVEYNYLGASQVVEVGYDEPDTKLDLWGGTVGTYQGLDRFGRTVDQRWINHSSSPVDVVRLQYGYDRNSNPLYRRDEVARAASKPLDELFTLDGLNRLNDYQRGLLNANNNAITTLDFQQAWQLDQVGNWTGFEQDNNGNGTNNLVQTRQHNKVNEITDITNTTGVAWIEPSYDKAGNTTVLPEPENPAEGFSAVYDAWNMLVAINEQDTGRKVAEYDHDARNYRIQKRIYNGFGSLSNTIDCYYTSAWQCIQEVETPIHGSLSYSSSFSGSSSGAGPVLTNYVYGLRYVDDLVCRERTTLGSYARQYYLTSRRFSVVALISNTGFVLERYTSSPYGQRTVLNASFNPKVSTSYINYRGFLGLTLDGESALIYNQEPYPRSKSWPIPAKGSARICGRHEPISSVLRPGWR